MRYFILTTFSLLVLAATGQNISGIWRGKLTQEPGGCFPEYFIELQIVQTAEGLSGVSFDYYDTTRYVKLNFTGQLNTLSKRAVLAEEKVTEFHIPRDCVPCIKTYDLTWSGASNEETLTGSWKGLEMGSILPCPPGNIFLKKVQQSAFAKPALIPVTQPHVAEYAFDPVRKIELVKTIVVDTSNIKVELYDNGQIDGDTISIFLNRELILPKSRLTEKAITLTIPVQLKREYEMVMFAENLGSIPPNTALMVVTAGKNKFEVYLSSSEHKSAAVKFVYLKPD